MQRVIALRGHGAVGVDEILYAADLSAEDDAFAGQAIALGRGGGARRSGLYAVLKVRPLGPSCRRRLLRLILADEL